MFESNGILLALNTDALNELSTNSKIRKIYPDVEEHEIVEVIAEDVLDFNKDLIAPDENGIYGALNIQEIGDDIFLVEYDRVPMGLYQYETL